MNASLPATTRDPSTLQAELTVALSQIVSDDALLQEREGITPCECDGLAAYRQASLTVVLPDTEAQVVEILRVYRRMGAPVVPRDVRTSLSGDTMSTLGGLVLSLIKFKHTVKVDPYTRTAVVQPSVRNLAISGATNPYRLYYAPDPPSQIACTIGGNVDENSGGVHCLKYNLTVHNILRVCAMMMDGEVVRFSSEAPDTSGFDPSAMVVGSEGMLTMMTEVTTRLVSKPQLAQVIMMSFGDMEPGGNAVADVIAVGIIPARLEMMDEPATTAMGEFVYAGYNLDVVAILPCESGGTPEEVAEEIAHMSEVLRASGATRIQVSQSGAGRPKFWSDRKNTLPTAGCISSDYYYINGTIPRKHIGTLLRRIRQMEQKYALRCINVFHAGDGDIYPLILFDDENQDGQHHAELFGSDILETCMEPGGTVTGEHGVGVEKSSSTCVQFSAEERDASLHVKATFGPVRLLNPDKAISTLACCAEYGKPYVRSGLLPHPDLPRF